MRKENQRYFCQHAKFLSPPSVNLASEDPNDYDEHDDRDDYDEHDDHNDQ